MVETLRQTRIAVEHLRAGFGQHEVLKSISVNIQDKALTAVMGPSGCGKSTFIRCINRLHEEIPGAWVRGKIIFDGQDLYAKSVDPVELRRKIGMVFQRANPFRTMSIYARVPVGPTLTGLR